MLSALNKIGPREIPESWAAGRCCVADRGSQTRLVENAVACEAGLYARKRARSTQSSCTGGPSKRWPNPSRRRAYSACSNVTRMQPAWLLPASAHRRSIGAKCLTLRVTTIRSSLAARRRTCSSGSAGRRSSSPSARTSWPLSLSGIPIRRSEKCASSRMRRAYPGASTSKESTNGNSSRSASRGRRFSASASSISSG